jgi:hypothetical protein
VNAGYSLLVTRGMLSLRPFIDAQFHHVALERGPATVSPNAVFRADAFWSFSLGARLFLGGGAMRMGAYGVLDPMTTMNRAPPADSMRMDESGHAGH